MCLLTYFPEGIMPNQDELSTGAKYNPHGHGFAIVIPEQDRILVRKSMTNPDKLISEFAAARLQYPEGPALFHSRITTAGVSEKRNCHPFMINGDRRTIMAHNGVFPSRVQPAKDDWRSDTRIVAETVADGFRLYTTKGRKRFGQWMGTNSKVAILTVDPAYADYGYIVNEKLGEWTGAGIWYSNGSYKPRSYGSHGGWDWEDDLIWEHCRFGCDSKTGTVSPTSGYCYKCDRCQFCEVSRRLGGAKGWAIRMCDCMDLIEEFEQGVQARTVLGYPDAMPSTGTVATGTPRAITTGIKGMPHITAQRNGHRFECREEHKTPEAVQACLDGYEMWCDYVDAEERKAEFLDTVIDGLDDGPTVAEFQEVMTLVKRLNSGEDVDAVTGDPDESIYDHC